MNQEQTYGQRAVGLQFNPSGNPAVNQLKTEAAAFIDTCVSISEESGDSDVKQMTDFAIKAAQEAQMWAVKAATWK